VPKNETIVNIDGFKDHLVIFLETNGASSLKILDMKTEVIDKVNLPEELENLAMITPGIPI
jgi:hypothetical protein